MNYSQYVVGCSRTHSNPYKTGNKRSRILVHNVQYQSRLIISGCISGTCILMNGEDYTPILNVIKQRKIDIQNISKPM